MWLLNYHMHIQLWIGNLNFSPSHLLHIPTSQIPVHLLYQHVSFLAGTYHITNVLSVLWWQQYVIPHKAIVMKIFLESKRTLENSIQIKPPKWVRSNFSKSRLVPEEVISGGWEISVKIEHINQTWCNIWQIMALMIPDDPMPPCNLPVQWGRCKLLSPQCCRTSSSPACTSSIRKPSQSDDIKNIIGQESST